MKKAKPLKVAVIGAGIAGLACARTLMQAGHEVLVFEKESGVGGRMASLPTDYGSFDHGTQFFTVRDPRFAQAMATAEGVCQPWDAQRIHQIDAAGNVHPPAPPPGPRKKQQAPTHWIASPRMDALAVAWAQPLLAQGRLQCNTEVTRIERDGQHSHLWQLALQERQPDQATQAKVIGGFDRVIVATPAWIAQAILASSLKKNDPHWSQVQALRDCLRSVEVAPCWSVMLAFALAGDPSNAIGPAWSSARSSDHRLAWINREGGKPGRQGVERWTLHATAAWSKEHFNDSADRVQGKLLKSFADLTGIRATPSMVTSKRWLNARTVKSLNQTFLWQADAGIGVCGDYLMGYRVEDAFVSGLEMALKVVGK
jgi:predicted NAD/FAD-dependent oxidoreductase